MSTKVLDRLKAQFGASILETSSFRGDDCAIVPTSSRRAVATFLRDDAECAFDHFIDITAVDYPEREADGIGRFDLVLHLRSMSKKHRVRLKARVKDGEEVDSLTSLWAGADWTEREVFDMFGIRFRGHPDLRRILMPEDFPDFPLRKDFPVQGKMTDQEWAEWVISRAQREEG